MKKFFTKATGLLAIVLVAAAGCNQPADIPTSPESALMNTIRARFDARDYVLDYSSVKNPYEQIGIDTRQIFSRVLSKLRAQKVKFNGGKNSAWSNSRFRLASNSSSGKIGIQDPAILGVVASEIADSPEVTLRREEVVTINRRMGNYSFDESGITSILDSAKEKKYISQIQYDLLETEWRELIKAKSYNEALIVNATVEAEVISSNIDESQKPLVLQVTSVIKNMIVAGMNEDTAGRVGSDSNFKMVAVLIPYVVAAIITVAAGFVIGWMSGGVLCGYAGTASCISSYAVGGSIIALVGWFAPASLWVMSWV